MLASRITAIIQFTFTRCLDGVAACLGDLEGEPAVARGIHIILLRVENRVSNKNIQDGKTRVVAIHLVRQSSVRRKVWLQVADMESVYQELGRQPIETSFWLYFPLLVDRERNRRLGTRDNFHRRSLINRTRLTTRQRQISIHPIFTIQDSLTRTSSTSARRTTCRRERVRATSQRTRTTSTS
jgi:hypothetical protein